MSLGTYSGDIFNVHAHAARHTRKHGYVHDRAPTIALHEVVLGFAGQFYQRL